MKKIRIILIIIIFIIIFAFLNRLVTPKYATSLVEGSMTSAYYEEEKNHEVIILGDCEVYANFSPMVMYEEQGITAYVRGNSQQMIWQSYYLLEETLKEEIPQIVVFSVGAMRNADDKNEAYNRLCLDQMKWSEQKANSIKASMTEDESFLSYVFPILRYHERISELTEEDFTYFFTNKVNTYNGFLINKEVKPYESLPTQKKLADYQFSYEAYEYLDKITELCKENGIELILIKAPSLYPYWYDEYDEQIKEYAEENDLQYINFIDAIEEIGIDFSCDTYDGGLHLNLTGATKLSSYFAEWLKSEYELTDYREIEEIDEIYQEKLKEYKEAIEA